MLYESDSSDKRDLEDTGYPFEESDGNRHDTYTAPETCGSSRATSHDLGFVATSSVSSVEYGPETFEAFKTRINTAANDLRPKKAGVLTPEQDEAIDKLVDKGSVPDYDTAFVDVVGVHKDEFYREDPQFTFTELFDLNTAERITNAKYKSDIDHVAKELLDENRSRQREGETLLSAIQIDEIIRLRDYKLPHLKKQK